MPKSSSLPPPPAPEALLFSDLKCRRAPFLCLISHFFAKSTPDLFLLPDSTITKEQADLSLNLICIISNRQLRIEFGRCVGCQVDSRVHSISVSYYIPQGRRLRPLPMKQLLYYFSQYFHLQEILVLAWREDGGYGMKPVPVSLHGDTPF